MCTVSWLQQQDGYQVFCNRDEKKDRREAQEPVVLEANGVRYLAPRDGNFGGSWIAVNEWGLTLCLLNGRTQERLPHARSRGLLLPELISTRSTWAAGERFWAMDMSSYAPLILLAVEPGQPAVVLEWDGIEKAVIPYGDPFLPLVSSSYDPDGVRHHRIRQLRQRIAETGLSAEVLREFHTSHGPAASAYSTCMHRMDAQTVSFSHVWVGQTGIRFAYRPGPPCGNAAVRESGLELRRC